MFRTKYVATEEADKPFFIPFNFWKINLRLNPGLEWHFLLKKIVCDGGIWTKHLFTMNHYDKHPGPMRAR